MANSGLIFMNTPCVYTLIKFRLFDPLLAIDLEQNQIKDISASSKGYTYTTGDREIFNIKHLINGIDKELSNN